MQYKDTAFLCGYFSVKTGNPAAIIASQGDFWSPVRHDDEELAWAKDFYYPEFAEFMMSEVKTFSHAYDLDFSIALSGNREHEVHLDELRTYLFPFGIVIWSVRVSQQSEQVQDMLDALFMMRSVCSLSQDAVKEYITLALNPLIALNKKAGGSGEFRALMECGNKLKIFHTLSCEESPANDEAYDALLYGGGTLRVYKENDPKGFSKEYYESIMSGSRVSVFNNWKALSLLDTYTIVAYDLPDHTLDFWNKEYFGKMYMYALYRKFFLFRINGDFRGEVKEISDVRKDLTVFEKDYAFPKVSYNFLPEILMTSMEKGLDVEQETVKIADIINRENARKEAETGDKMNLFLGVITCLTLFSAIWDFACLMDGVFEFSTNIGTATGIRACAMALLSIICMAAIFVRRKQ